MCAYDKNITCLDLLFYKLSVLNQFWLYVMLLDENISIKRHTT